MAAKDVITLGIGAPGSIKFFILVGLDIGAVAAAAVTPTTYSLRARSQSTIASDGRSQSVMALRGRSESAIALPGEV